MATWDPSTDPALRFVRAVEDHWKRMPLWSGKEERGVMINYPEHPETRITDDPFAPGGRHATIALDFDGVLHRYDSGYTGPIPFDKPVDGAQAFVKELLSRRYEVTVFTTRAHPYLERENRKAFVEYLQLVTKSSGFPQPSVDDHESGNTEWAKVGNGPSIGAYGVRAWLLHHGFPEHWARSCTITHKKSHADLFLDDRGFRFDPDPGQESEEFAWVLQWLSDNPTCKPWGKQA